MSDLPVSDLVSALLVKRGVSSDGIAAFLNPDYDVHTHSPSLMQGMDTAVARVFAALERNERIAIYADFDCDGIPGAAVLSDFFAKTEYSNVEVYLPHRDREGYGFHAEAISELAGREVKLIITVDVGTTAVDSVAHAKTLGVDVIVTDHHEIPGGLPAAVAVINPKLGEYPFPHLCGAGTAFKLATALLEEGRRRELPNFMAIPLGWEKWLLDLVAIATVADMVPLVGENRALVRWGITVLRKSQRPGIAALCTRLRLRRAELTEDDIGFSIAPRVNAASRMDEPMLAFRLLTTKDREEADALAAQLETLNASRKGVVGGIVREARKRVRGRFTDSERVVVLGDPEWKPALLGLAANSIVGDRGGLVCMWGRDANGRIKGSCRSDGALSVVDVFTAASSSLEEYGGHAASGGFSVSAEQVHSLQEVLTAASKALVSQKVETAREHDGLISLREVSWALYRDISQLAPFGVGNPKPIFRIAGVRVAAVRAFGKEKNHIEVSLACATTSATARAFDFFRTAEAFSCTPVENTDVVVLATIERDSFRGGMSLRLIDVLPAA